MLQVLQKDIEDVEGNQEFLHAYLEAYMHLQESWQRCVSLREHLNDPDFDVTKKHPWKGAQRIWEGADRLENLLLPLALEHLNGADAIETFDSAFQQLTTELNRMTRRFQDPDATDVAPRVLDLLDQMSEITSDLSKVAQRHARSHLEAVAKMVDEILSPVRMRERGGMPAPQANYAAAGSFVTDRPDTTVSRSAGGELASSGTGVANRTNGEERDGGGRFTRDVMG
jgi:hypothetical protein